MIRTRPQYLTCSFAAVFSKSAGSHQDRLDQTGQNGQHHTAAMVLRAGKQETDTVKSYGMEYLG